MGCKSYDDFYGRNCRINCIGVYFSMIMAIIILILLGIALICWGTKIVLNHLAYTKRMKALVEWQEFHNQLIVWLEEIEDVKVRSEFMDLMVSYLISPLSANDGRFQNWNVREEKMKVFQKFGKWIPSLTMEIRDWRINQLIEEK